MSINHTLTLNFVLIRLFTIKTHNESNLLYLMPFASHRRHCNVNGVKCFL